MTKIVIGRKQELGLLQEALETNEAEMVSIIGRRRVGKTFLVTTAYQDRLIFEMTGTQGVSSVQQLKNFRDQIAILSNSTLPLEIPADWLDAFRMLRSFLEPRISKEKKVIFFDELPWLAHPKSGFLEAFGYFWNNWASRQNLVVVICGSAASWMIRKVVHNKGGLHNRITKNIQLFPFTLAETELYLKSRNIHLDRYQILHLYLAMGGVPHYLKEIKKGFSAAQNIERICFSQSGILQDEFSKLYPALFKNAERHMSVIRLLAEKRSGMTRKEVLEKLKSTSGGGITSVLEELEQSGFIASYHPFGNKKKEKLFRLTDEYSIFYLHFIEGKIYGKKGAWLNLSQTQEYQSWSGFAFEGMCLKHLEQIKEALGISGVYSAAYSFLKKGGPQEKGAQIDLVLDRNDHVVNLFEIKFYNDTMSMDQSMAGSIRSKTSVFKSLTNTKKQVFWTLVTTFGLQHNQYSLGLIDSVITLDDLFR